MKVWCNGSFDVIHYGHFKLLEYAASYGDLHVGLDSSKRIQEKKGKNRPFHTWEQRREILMGFKFINNVYFFDSDETLTGLIKMISPDFMVIGSDYRDKEIIGVNYVKNLVYFERIKDFSTTKILNVWDTK